MPERIQLSTEWGYHVNTKAQWSWIISEKNTFSMLATTFNPFTQGQATGMDGTLRHWSLKI